jgi:hypothetical protein
MIISCFSERSRSRQLAFRSYVFDRDFMCIRVLKQLSRVLYLKWGGPLHSMMISCFGVATINASDSFSGMQLNGG